MAGTIKFTALTALTSVSLQSDDVLPIVDVHDTTMAPTGTDKKITVANLFTPPMPVLAANGTAAAPSYAFANDPDCGFYRISANRIGLSLNGSQVADYQTSIVTFAGALTSSGAFTVAAGGAAITGNSAITGTLGVSSSLTVTGSTTLSSGLTVSASGASITGNSTITGTLGGISTLTATTFVGNLTGNITGTAPAGTLTGTTLASNVVTSSLTTVGVIASGTWQGTTVGAGFGGTGLASYTAGDLPYASGTTTLSKLGIGAANRVLTSSGSAPQWSATLTGLTSVAATTFTGALTGNASTATALQTARTINGVAFDGTANIIVSAGTVGTLTFGTYLQAGAASFSGSAATISTNATALNTVSTLVARDGSGNFAAGTITAALTGNVTGNCSGTSGSTTGNAATATILANTRTIWGQNFNGSANVSGAFSGATTGSFSDDVTLATTKGLVWGGNRLLNYNTSTNILFVGEAGSGLTSIQFPVGGIIGATLSTAGALTLASGITLGGALSGATTGAFSDTVSVTKASGVSLATLSGGGTNFTRMSLGRTGADAYIGVAGSAGQLVSGSVSGDFCFSSVNKSILWSVDDGATKNMALTASGLSITGTVTGGTYNGQTISSAASFTGTLTTAGSITSTSGGLSLNDAASAVIGYRVASTQYGYIGVGTANSNITGAALGDQCIVTFSKRILLSTDSGTTIHGQFSAGALSILGAFNTTSTTDSTSTGTGSIQTAGGLGVVKSVVVGADVTARHYKGGGSAPTATTAITGASVAVTGTDSAMTVTVTTTAVGWTAGATIATVTFATAYAAKPRVVICPNFSGSFYTDDATPGTNFLIRALGSFSFPANCILDIIVIA